MTDARTGSPAPLKAAMASVLGSRYTGGVGESGKPEPGLHLAPQRPSPDAIRAAELALPRAEELMAPVGAQHLSEWLFALGEALPIGGGTSEERVFVAIKTATEVCGRMPAVCFTPESRVKVMRQCEFFPGPAKLYAILSEIEAEASKRLWSLREIAKYAGQPAAKPDEARQVTDEDRARVAAALAQIKADAAAREACRPAAAGAPSGRQVQTASVDKLALARSASPKVLVTRPDYRAALEMAARAQMAEAAE